MRWILIAAGVGAAYWYFKNQKMAVVPDATAAAAGGCLKRPRYMWAGGAGEPERCWDRCERRYLSNEDSAVCDLE